MVVPLFVLSSKMRLPPFFCRGAALTPSHTTPYWLPWYAYGQAIMGIRYSRFLLPGFLVHLQMTTMVTSSMTSAPPPAAMYTTRVLLIRVVGPVPWSVFLGEGMTVTLLGTAAVTLVNVLALVGIVALVDTGGADTLPLCASVVVEAFVTE
eukprot:scpid110097/ scgid15299/ 